MRLKNKKKNMSKTQKRKMKKKLHGGLSVDY